MGMGGRIAYRVPRQQYHPPRDYTLPSVAGVYQIAWKRQWPQNQQDKTKPVIFPPSQLVQMWISNLPTPLVILCPLLEFANWVAFFKVYGVPNEKCCIYDDPPEEGDDGYFYNIEFFPWQQKA